MIILCPNGLGMMEWHRNDGLMSEWAANDKMVAEWGRIQNQRFCLTSKISLISPSFSHSKSFWNDETAWNEAKMNGMAFEWHPSFVIFIPWHSRMTRNDRMRRNDGIFGSQQKTEFWDTSHSAIILSFRPHSNKNWLAMPNVHWISKELQWNDQNEIGM